MSGMQATKMVVLDFSGTLSLEAALYARERNLIRELKLSGLWQMGVNGVAIFWDQIVDPTWQEGSTTAKGYKRCMFERVTQIAGSSGDRPSEDEIWASVSRFVDSYFHHSLVDPEWGGVLRDLLARPEVMIVVATDHYAEASGHILSQLQSLGVNGAPALRAEGTRRVLVANSADLGHHKASKSFWQVVKKAQGVEALSQVVIVDDFGFNEQPLDTYAEQKKIRERLSKTVELLSTVFDAHTSAFPFFIRGEARGALPDRCQFVRAYRDLIRRAGRFASTVLARD